MPAGDRRAREHPSDDARALRTRVGRRSKGGRKNYLRRLIREAGFNRVRTYGDFQEMYKENEPDFFIHIAEKSVGAERPDPKRPFPTDGSVMRNGH